MKPIYCFAQNQISLIENAGVPVGDLLVQRGYGIFDYLSNNQGANFAGFQHNLEYSQKQLTNVLLNGKHNFEERK